jgi:BirA family biotin operon repressor/biotin-[acetyl-CoA-carboxylase] ligase
MDLGWELVNNKGFPQGSWVLAMIQAQGRGQLGRAWVSSRGNLFGTVRLSRACHPLATLLPLCLALVVVEVLADLAINARIKWPNDILVAGKKVGGILVEERNGVVLAGFGMNLIPPGPTLSFKNSVGCLAESCIILSVPRLWHLIIEKLSTRLPLCSRDPGSAKQAIEASLAHVGESVVFTTHDKKETLVTINGISSRGELIIETLEGEQWVTSGRISPRLY